jgi:TonB family protein
MQFLLNAALILAFTQTLSLSALAQGAIASTAPALAAASDPPKMNNLKVDLGKDCAIPAYPDAAIRFGMQGSTVLNLMIDDSGKINAFQLIRSSGWKFLDHTVMQAIIGCQVLPVGNWIPSERRVNYWWQFDKGYTSRAVLDPKSCKDSEKLRIADDRDEELGIVVGIYVSETGKVLDAKVQWGNEEQQLDQESLRIAKSCEYAPAERSGKRIANADSIRFVQRTVQNDKMQ